MGGDPIPVQKLVWRDWRSGRLRAARPEWRVARYPRKVRWLAGCIMIAATLRQTAAPVANVKSEIHMA